jgi:cytoskeletal protein RodZ
MRILIGIVVALLILSLVWFILPQNVKRAVNPFNRSTQTASKSASPSPTSSNRVVVVPPQNSTYNPFPTAAPTSSIAARGTATATPRSSASPTPTSSLRAVAQANTDGTTTTGGATGGGLPGTGDVQKNPEVLVIDFLAAVLLSLVGYKLSRHA